MLSSTNQNRPPRPAEWNPQKAMLFAVTLAATGRVTLACRAAGMSRKSAYALKARDPVFAAAWDQARQAASHRQKARQAVEARLASSKVTPRTRAAPSALSISPAEQAVLDDLLRTRPWLTAQAPRAAGSLARALSARGRASA